MFYKYDCDCVGLVVDGGDPVIIQACDTYHGDDPVSFYRRNMGDKEKVALTPEWTEYYIKLIGRMVTMGGSYLTIRHNLERKFPEISRPEEGADPF